MSVAAPGAKGIGRSLRTYHAPGRAALLDGFHRRFLGPGDLAFDIGAHVGDRAASFRRLGAKVVALEPREYQQWLTTGAPAGTLTSVGEQEFAALGCVTCHNDTDNARGPSLAGVYGKPQQLANGATVIADDAYLRESILNPQAKMVQGYQPLMPTYQGQISEDALVTLLAYIKSLQSPTATPGPGTSEAATPAATH